MVVCGVCTMNSPVIAYTGQSCVSIMSIGVGSSLTWPLLGEGETITFSSLKKKKVWPCETT